MNKEIKEELQPEYVFSYFPNHGDEDGRNCFTVCYGDWENSDEIIIACCDTEEDAIESCKRLNEILRSKTLLSTLLAGEDKWISVNNPPNVGGEYNVIWDLEDGGEPVVSTMDYDAIKKKWFDTRGANDDVTDLVISWRELPKKGRIKEAPASGGVEQRD